MTSRTSFSTKDAIGLSGYVPVYPAAPKYAVVGADSQVVEVQLAPGETIKNPRALYRERTHRI